MTPAAFIILFAIALLRVLVAIWFVKWNVEAMIENEIEEIEI